MSVVRLELTVPDSEAHEVANRLAAEYIGVIGERTPHASVVVEVLTDEKALRDRTILRAVGYFMPEPP